MIIENGPFHRAIKDVPNNKEVIFDHIEQFCKEVLDADISDSRSRSDFSMKEGDNDKKFVGCNMERSDPSNFFLPQPEGVTQYRPVMKAVGIYCENDPDEFQGGFLACRNWKEHRKDNFGEDIGDPNNHIPYWINEKGSLLIVPSWEVVYMDILVSGECKRTGYHVFGGAYK